jgi:hypothetical protein
MGCEGMYARRRGGDEADRASKYERGGRHFTPGRPALPRAPGAKELNECMISLGQLRDLIRMQEAWPVTPRDCTEVYEC